MWIICDFDKILLKAWVELVFLGRKQRLIKAFAETDNNSNQTESNSTFRAQVSSLNFLIFPIFKVQIPKISSAQYFPCHVNAHTSLFYTKRNILKLQRRENKKSLTLITVFSALSTHLIKSLQKHKSVLSKSNKF